MMQGKQMNKHTDKYTVQLHGAFLTANGLTFGLCLERWSLDHAQEHALAHHIAYLLLKEVSLNMPRKTGSNVF